MRQEIRKHCRTGPSACFPFGSIHGITRTNTSVRVGITQTALISTRWVRMAPKVPMISIQRLGLLKIDKGFLDVFYVASQKGLMLSRRHLRTPLIQINLVEESVHAVHETIN